MSTQRGTLIDGRYRIEELIAEGGFGAVFRATHLGTGCEVAVKILRSVHDTDAEIAARFEQEGELLARLRHPSTVMLFELGTTCEGQRYIAMEMLRGESLRDRLQRVGPLGWHQAITIVRDTCAALAEAHALGIVHRDLKPANIHLEPWSCGLEQVKVIDFGIAKLLRGNRPMSVRDLTVHGEVLGTPDYMAPEQLLGDTVDERADIYALGVLLYEMLTTCLPFSTGSLHHTLMLHLEQRPPPLPSSIVSYADGELADDLDRIVLRCLAGDPNDRYQSANDLVEALDSLERRALRTLRRPLPDRADTIPCADPVETMTTRLGRGSNPAIGTTTTRRRFARGSIAAPRPPTTVTRLIRKPPRLERDGRNDATSDSIPPRVCREAR